MVRKLGKVNIGIGVLKIGKMTFTENVKALSLKENVPEIETGQYPLIIQHSKCMTSTHHHTQGMLNTP